MRERSRNAPERLRVLITVDTEFWPQRPSLSGPVPLARLSIAKDIARDLYGVTGRGEYGVRFQLEVFAEHAIRAVFFVEALSASVVGLGHLRDLVSTIRSARQDIELHLHTEWLLVEPNAILPGRVGRNLHDFTLDEQTHLLQRGRSNLLQAGADWISAYRAGNFGANNDTLVALAGMGIEFDSSYNLAYLTSACRISLDPPPFQPIQSNGVWEFPVSCFEDRPGHVRPAHVNATSTPELTHVLEMAWQSGWHYFIVVTHSHELLNRDRSTPNLIVATRLRKLCKFLERNRDRFETVTFKDLATIPIEAGGPASVIRSNILQTLWRVGEQVAQRWIP
jgi:hypothetical protein